MSLVAAALAGLTACAGAPATAPTATPGTAAPSPSASATPAVTRSPMPPASSSLDSIKVSGAWLKEPKVEVKAPFGIDKTRSKAIIQGKGPKATADAYLQLHYYGVNGSTGKVFDQSYAAGQPVIMSLSSVVAGFKNGLVGQQEGSRVLIAMPGSDGYDSNGGQPSADIEVGDTLIFVVDLVQVQRTGPEGETVTPKAGLPTVSGTSGTPTIDIPQTTAPTSMQSQVLVKGTGPKITAKDTILTHYVGYSWKNRKAIDTHYDQPDVGQLSAAIPGWQKGLVGQTVGSRVLLVLPPSDSFPQGSNNPPVDAGDTVVYLVDVLMAVTEPDQSAQASAQASPAQPQASSGQ